ncbi:hypothetical protein C8F01DRAFT_443195 [Mycena amicta]|nr:hypothetical protein C8F01DRAFT_443195 [Mycena amicta]
MIHSVPGPLPTILPPPPQSSSTFATTTIPADPGPSNSTASQTSSTSSNNSKFKTSTTRTSTTAPSTPARSTESTLQTVAASSSTTMSQSTTIPSTVTGSTTSQSSSRTTATSLGGVSSTDMTLIRVVLPATLIPLFAVLLIAGIILLLRKFRRRPTTRTEPYRLHWQQRFVHERFGARRIKSLAEDGGERVLDTEALPVAPNTCRVSEDLPPSYHSRP